MFRNILIAIDGSDFGNRALLRGLELAQCCDASVLILTVTERFRAYERVSGAGHALEELAGAMSESILNSAAQEAQQHGVEYQMRHIGALRPSVGILAAAREAGCDLIVISSHSRPGLNKVLLGSQAQDVLAMADIPVFLVR